MERHRIEILLRAEQPIAHAEGTIGNTQVAMRRKVRLPNGRWTKIPYVTGDTMRHGLREAGTYALLEAAGMLNAGPGLTEAALRLLFSGGMVLGAAAEVVRIEDARKMRELLPHIGLLGGCIGNRIEPGKIECGDAMLVCDEWHHLTPQWIVDMMTSDGAETSSAREHIELVQRVRMDPTLDSKKRALMSGTEQIKTENRLLASEVASARDDAAAKDREKSTMMPFTFETLAAGSLFVWKLDAVTHTQLERDTLYVMLAAFLARARVGGKKGTGHGLLVPVAARGLERDVSSSPASLDALAVTGDNRAPEIARFRAHVAQHADELKATLEKIQA